MTELKFADIFNYEFDCYNTDGCTSNCGTKNKCCNKYMKKGKNYCKKCPKQAA